MKPITIKDIDITGGFWNYRQTLNKEVTANAVYDRFKETGRFDATKCDPNSNIIPHIYWDSDIAKWIEGASYILEKNYDQNLIHIIEDVIDNIEKNVDENGYFNSYFLLEENKGKQWTERDWHELYCAGHLIEAAVAYYNATGKDRFLKYMCRFADHIYDVFLVHNEAAFRTPGHEEIELALVKLWECTGNEKYLKLSEHFVNSRGKGVEMNISRERINSKATQSHLPVREQKTAEGHSVRALYLYSAMADLARITKDKDILDSCRRIFDDIANHKMYITGGVGSTRNSESFTIPYDLPNERAYTESCAAIALCMFTKRMLMIEPDSKYADICETALYNGFLSSTSLDGKAFFYENPLEVHPRLRNREQSIVPVAREQLAITQRVEVFECSCCPPNIVRFVPSFGEYMYNYDESTIYIHHFAQSTAKIGDAEIEQITDYPNNSKITFKIKNAQRIAIRVPGWCESFVFTLNGETISPDIIRGYAYIGLNGDSIIEADFEIKTQLIEANPAVVECAGKVAVKRGVFVYCAEAVDNGENISVLKISANTEFKETYLDEYKTYVLDCHGFKPDFTQDTLYKKVNAMKETPIRLIPYYCFANRGETEMVVWLGRYN